ncbi:hypothetical protein JMUB6875_29110 [Nocardia sp. JMUB6875]
MPPTRTPDSATTFTLTTDDLTELSTLAEPAPDFWRTRAELPWA